MSDTGSSQSEGQQAPAGWYTVEGQQRYWNGSAWTEHVAPPQNQPAEGSGQAAFGQHQQPQPGGQAAFGQHQQPQRQQPDAQTGFGQPTHQAGGEPPANDDKLLAMLAHLGGILFSFLPSLVLWLIKKDESRFIGDHAKEALNFQISVLGAWLALRFASTFIGLTGLPLIGGLLGFFQLGLWLGSVAFSIIGGITANKGESYTYPLSVRLVK